MKKSILILLTSLFSISLFAGEVKLCHYGGYLLKKNCIVTEEEINVRSGPGTNYSKLFKVHAGDRVYVMEECSEEMFADGAYAKWYKIDCENGTGYMCGRWLSSIYDQYPQRGEGSEFIAYEYIYSRPEPYDPDWGWEEHKFVSDKLMYITKGKVKKLDQYFGPEHHGPLKCPDEIQIIEDAFEKENTPLVLIRSFNKWGSGWLHPFAFYKLENGSLSYVYEGESNWEGEYTYITIAFPNKTYDSRTGEWETKKSPYKYETSIIIETGDSYNSGNEKTEVYDLYKYLGMLER